jgi:transposase
MKDAITSYVGLDIHKDSIAIVVAEAGRAAPRFIGTTPSEPAVLCRALTRCATRSSTLVVYEAGPCGYGWAYQGTSSWTAAHERPLAAIKFDHSAQQSAFGGYRHAVKDAHERAERLTQGLREQCAQWRMRGVVNALMCLRGLDFIAAITVVVELGDLSRFAHPKALMKYLGLIPSEFSSGNARRQGSITKAGNKHVRRIFVEAAWTYRFNPRVSWPIEVRQQGQPKAIREIAWKAQLRLTYRFRKLNAGGKMTQNKCCVAMARELAAFIWDIARKVKIPA